MCIHRNYKVFFCDVPNTCRTENKVFLIELIRAPDWNSGKYCATKWRLQKLERSTPHYDLASFDRNHRYFDNILVVFLKECVRFDIWTHSFKEIVWWMETWLHNYTLIKYTQAFTRSRSWTSTQKRTDISTPNSINSKTKI